MVDLAGVVHAQLHHANAVLRRHAKQGQRHTNGVVEVTLRGQCGIACVGTQNAGNHLRDRSLAIAAGHGNQGQRKLAAPACRQRAQGYRGVWHLNARQAQRLQPAMRNGSGSQSLAFDLRQKVIRIHALAFERHKQVSGLQRAAVGMHAQQRRGSITHQPRLRLEGGNPRQSLLQIHHHLLLPLRKANAPRALSISENGYFTPWISW